MMILLKRMFANPILIDVAMVECLSNDLGLYYLKIKDKNNETYNFSVGGMNGMISLDEDDHPCQSYMRIGEANKYNKLAFSYIYQEASKGKSCFELDDQNRFEVSVVGEDEIIVQNALKEVDSIYFD